MPSGISGDMMLGALIDAGFPLSSLKKEISKLNLAVTINAERESNIITATNITIHSEDHTERNLHDIVCIIKESNIDDMVKQQAIALFTRIAEVEARIHGVNIEQIHFHELGAVDTIVDIVGSLAAMRYLRIEKLYASPVTLGRGTVTCQHGVLPVPAPATLELLKTASVIFTETPTELTTPTGAALASMAEFSFPSMNICTIGYGKGKKKLHMPNILRIVIGEPIAKAEGDICVLETNIDDMNPELYPHIIEQVIKAGALDAFVIPIIMKKGRTGCLLTVLTTYDLCNLIQCIIFQETNTFGIRHYKVQRDILERRQLTVNTSYGNVPVKIGMLKNVIMSVSPEFEECKRIASEKQVPLKEVYAEVLVKARENLKNYLP